MQKMQSKGRMMRVGEAHIEAAHKYVEKTMGRRLRDRQAVEACIDGVGDEAMARLANLFTERSRAFTAVNTFLAMRALTGEDLELRFAPEGLQWWLVRRGENRGSYPLGQVSKAEMDGALAAAGLEGLAEVH